MGEGQGRKIRKSREGDRGYFSLGGKEPVTERDEAVRFWVGKIAIWTASKDDYRRVLAKQAASSANAGKVHRKMGE